MHGGATIKYCVGVAVFADVDITLANGTEGSFMDDTGVRTQERSLVEYLRIKESHVANSGNLAVAQIIFLLQGEGGCSSFRMVPCCPSLPSITRLNTKSKKWLGL